jgi:hypothetical protein
MGQGVKEGKELLATHGAQGANPHPLLGAMTHSLLGAKPRVGREDGMGMGHRQVVDTPRGGVRELPAAQGAQGARMGRVPRAAPPTRNPKCDWGAGPTDGLSAA